MTEKDYFNISVNEFKMFIESMNGGELLYISCNGSNDDEKNNELLQELSVYSSYVLKDAKGIDDFKSIHQYQEEELQECVMYALAMNMAYWRDECKKAMTELKLKSVFKSKESKDDTR